MAAKGKSRRGMCGDLERSRTDLGLHVDWDNWEITESEEKYCLEQFSLSITILSNTRRSYCLATLTRLAL